MAERKVIAESNGHRWFQYERWQACLDCGKVRRSDDKNKPCTKVMPRITLRTAQKRAKGE